MARRVKRQYPDHHPCGESMNEGCEQGGKDQLTCWQLLEPAICTLTLQLQIACISCPLPEKSSLDLLTDMNSHRMYKSQGLSGDVLGPIAAHRRHCHQRRDIPSP